MSGLRIDLPDAVLDLVAERVADLVVQRLAGARSAEKSSANAWLSTKQAAEHLGITPNALHKLTSAREVPFSQDKPGGRCWFKAEDLDEWRREKAA